MKTKEFINKLENDLFALEMINENDHKYIKNFFNTKSVLSQLIQMLNNHNYHTKKIFEVFEPLLSYLAYDAMPEEPLKYFYNYTLHLAYPEVVEVEIEEKYEKVSKVFLTILRDFAVGEKKSYSGQWLSEYPMEFLSEDEIEALEDAAEYRKFIKAFDEEYVYELMKLNQEIVGYTTLNHVCGVHFLSLNIARQLKKYGINVDLGRVSGAAAGHDIGKYGCKKPEQHKVAYYHYYYTGEWFQKRDITYIRNVAINHSTWDLELEDLSLESLILIYADFRVKSTRDEQGNKQMRFFTLKEAFDVILNKLDNVDAEKEKRYIKVYNKLRDFEHYLKDLGINTVPDTNKNKSTYEKKEKFYSILEGKEIIQNTRFLSIEHNIKLMYMLRNEKSLNKLLEVVRSGRDSNKLRGYVEILNEYSTYLTQNQKIIVIQFLFSNLISPEEDIREICGILIGKLIATYDEEVRKEIPQSALRTEPEMTSYQLFNRYINNFLEPSELFIDKHKAFISYSLREMIYGYFRNIDCEKVNKSISILLKYFREEEMSEKREFHLLKLTRILPYDKFTTEQFDLIINFIIALVKTEDKKLKLRALNAFYELHPHIDKQHLKTFNLEEIVMENKMDKKDPAENFAWFKLAELLEMDPKIVDEFRQICLNDLKYTSDIFLSNLKSATYDISKRFQIELLLRNTIIFDYSNSFYTALHLCNLLKVSALENVRNAAGKGLIRLFPHLTFEQKNDIVIELIRALEMESYEFTKYIPQYLGKLLLHLKPVEFDEIITHFYDQLASQNYKLASLFQKTIAESIKKYPMYRETFKEDPAIQEERLVRMLGIILSGFSRDESFVIQSSLNTLGKDIFGSHELSMIEKKEIFNLIIKKVISLVVKIDDTNDLIFINNAAALKHIYTFISNYEFEYLSLSLKTNKKVAFFPGAFDPFSRSHREIAVQIRNMGYEVFLAVDEFSWSKKTQPNLIRRNIIRKSIAKELGVYILPKDISVNITNDKDIINLKAFLRNRRVYMVAGSDVLVNASAYRKLDSELIKLPHLIFERDKLLESEDQERLDYIVDQLPDDSCRFRLEMKYEFISSTKIRNYIDKNRDISEFVDPFAQKYIYDNNLYSKEPQYKGLITTKSIKIDVEEYITQEIIDEIYSIVDMPKEDFQKIIDRLTSRLNFRLLIIRDITGDGNIIGFCGFHWVRSRDIHSEFDDKDIMRYVIENSIGRILILDCVFTNNTFDLRYKPGIVLGETLSFAIAKDYTYCIYLDKFNNKNRKEINEYLEWRGFQPIDSAETECFVVDMSSPMILNLDLKSIFKEPFKNNKALEEVFSRTRIRLQKVITELYPGKLLLNYNRIMLYENLIKKVCSLNNVSTIPSPDNEKGEVMCVPFGSIFKRWILPNTVTKTLHVEKYFNEELTYHAIKSAPFYMDIDNQVQMIKSFNRPVILVDDLFNKGYRLKVLEPYLKKHNIDVKKVVVGILSGNGKAIIKNSEYEIESAYFIPNIKVWFYESRLYPFIGGDGVWRGKEHMKKYIQSINMLLPYTNPRYIKGASREKIYKLSEVALENTLEILLTLEKEYQKENYKMLTLSNLGEVIIEPKIPDKGSNIHYNMHMSPSEYVKEDLNLLKRLK